MYAPSAYRDGEKSSSHYISIPLIDIQINMGKKVSGAYECFVRNGRMRKDLRKIGGLIGACIRFHYLNISNQSRSCIPNNLLF
jgi:hypothetical protein